MDKQEVFTPKYSAYLYTKYSVYSVYPNQLNLTSKYCFIPKRKYIQGHKQHIYKNECESASHSVVFNSLRPHGLYSLRNSPVQNTGVGILSLLQGIFQTQGVNPGLLHCRQILYCLSHQASSTTREATAMRSPLNATKQ